MKKLFAAVLAVLCLAGCSQKPDDFEVVGAITVKPDAVVEEVPEVEEVPVEEVVVEEPAEELTEEAPENAIDTYAMSEDKLEGLVGDTIGYSFDTPVFAGFDGTSKQAVQAKNGGQAAGSAGAYVQSASIQAEAEDTATGDAAVTTGGAVTEDALTGTVDVSKLLDMDELYGWATVEGEGLK